MLNLDGEGPLKNLYLILVGGISMRVPPWFSHIVKYGSHSLIHHLRMMRSVGYHCAFSWKVLIYTKISLDYTLIDLKLSHNFKELFEWSMHIHDYSIFHCTENQCTHRPMPLEEEFSQEIWIQFKGLQDTNCPKLYQEMVKFGK